jgi:hypothetical protein
VEIYRSDEQTVVIEDLDLFLCELLRKILESADPSGSENARRRLYSSPTQGTEPDFDEEWKEYVEPELREGFQSALDVVQGDLADLPEGDPDTYCTLHIPVEHLDGWIHALNQARLALGARHDVTDEDMENIPTGGDARALAIFQIHFYGYLQERFLHELEE